jgi:hypothetical protein
MRRSILGIALASSALVLGTVAAAPSASAAPETQQFDATGAAQTFTVPTGIRCISVNAYGAAGGSASSDGGHLGVDGGLGGRAFAQEVPVTPGEVLSVLVGTRGGNGTSGSGAGGFNGGGKGAFATLDPGGGGGGASEVNRGSTRLVVAGGGGGAGGNGHQDTGAGSGGAGGGLTGTAGLTNNGSGGGGGGTQTGGGTAGVGTLVGHGGTSGHGADGVTGLESGSGGGGGGWFGGGSGGASADEIGGGGGSGGGSGFGPPGTFFETGSNNAPGVVVIGWDTAKGECTGLGSTPGTPADDLTPIAAPSALTAAPHFTG